MQSPDFWLVECDTFWHELGVDRVACRIIDGPARMLADYEIDQWLVKVEPAVTDHGVTTDLVLIDKHDPSWSDGRDWALFCTGVYSLQPQTRDRIGGHKMTVTTRPDLHA